MTLKTEVGHYTANGKIFQTKFEAVLEAQSSNTPLSWYFHDDVLNKVDWKTEPDLSIDALYKIRAEQIRNAYDYAIVFCSIAHNHWSYLLLEYLSTCPYRNRGIFNLSIKYYFYELFNYLKI